MKETKVNGSVVIIQCNITSPSTHHIVKVLGSELRRRENHQRSMLHAEIPIMAIFGVLITCTLLPVLGASLSKTVLYQAPDECRWTGFNENDIVLVCHLRTINSELENTNFSVIQPQNTVRLRLECNDALFFQSSLSPGSFRALVELRSLTIEYCKLGNLTEGSFSGLQDLHNLTIRTHNGDWSVISLDVSPNAFSDFRQLNRLDLSQNNIWSIPDGMICPLKDMSHLNMSSNRIQDIGNFHFSASLSTRKSRICGTSLETIDLSNNKISNLPSAIFSALGRLKNLYLRRNEMNFIADRAFEGLVSLSTVDLSENKLSNLPPELFSEAKYVKEIYLRNNTINVLAPGLFSDLAELLVLDLGHNELSSQWVNAATFVGLKRLILLDLSNNKINKLESTIFRNLYTLQILKLQDNYIDAIPENTFAELTNLHTLILSNNRLSTIDSHTLRGLYGILILSLDYNRISRIDALALKNCSSLQDLHLNGNELSAVPDVLHYVPLLKTLDLGENHITTIENASFSSMENLFGLRLTENAIEYVKRGVFDRMQSLQILNLSRNKIRTIEPGTFHKNSQLQAIRLDGNYLMGIDGLFTDLPNLVWLNISDNHFEMFDYSHIPTGLQWLDIHANRIVQLSNYFEIENELTLTHFDASANRLTEITANAIPNSVEMLYLNDNLISKVQSYTFFKKPNLTRVDLFGNKISTLDPNALRLSPVPDDKSIPEFYIGGNPFQCDCNLDWLQKTNVESRTQPKLMDLSSIYCKLLYNRGKSYVPLIEAKSNDFLCKYETHCFALCHCCDFYACDCKMECPSGCTCYHDQSWTSNVVDCSRAGYKSQLPAHIPMDSTQLYLDGNHLEEIGSHAFIGRKKLKILFLNHSRVERIHNRTFYGLRELEVLQLNHNSVEHLNGNEFEGLENLRELYLQFNKISTIDNFTFAQLHHLKTLRLDHNAIVEFVVWHLPPYLTELRLADNPWQCSCQFIANFRDYINRHDFVLDKTKIRCTMPMDIRNDTISNRNEATTTAVALQAQQKTPLPPAIIQPSTNSGGGDDGGYLIYLSNISIPCIGAGQLIDNITNGNLTSVLSKKTILSPKPIQEYMPVLIAMLTGFLLVIIVTLLVFIFRQEMRVWFHSRFGIRLFYKGQDIDKNERDKLFDAFISYSSKDEAFVAEDLAPMLENGDPHYKLCLHYRDFPVGAYIADTIVQAIESSRRTIMVLSENFIKSEWCRFEFKSAHHQVLRDRKRRLIVILLGEVPQKDLDPDIRLYLKTNTYLQWGDKLFWEKLRFALPDVPNNQRRMVTNCNFAAHTNFRHNMHHGTGNSNRQSNRNHNQTTNNQMVLTPQHQHQQQQQQQQPPSSQQPPLQHGRNSSNSSSPRTVAIHI